MRNFAVVLLLLAACTPRAAPLKGVLAPDRALPSIAMASGHRHFVFRWDYQEGDIAARGDGSIRAARQAFRDFTIGDVIKLDQRVTLDRDSPLQWTPDISACKLTIHSDDGIRKGRNRQPAQSCPHERRWWYVTARKIGVRRAQGISDQNRAARAQSAAQKEIEPRAVGGCGANGSIAASSNVTFLIVPPEDEMPMPARHGNRRKRAIRGEHALERSRARSAGREEKKNDGEVSHCGSTLVIRSPWTSLSSTSNPRITRPNTV